MCLVGIRSLSTSYSYMLPIVIFFLQWGMYKGYALSILNIVCWECGAQIICLFNSQVFILRTQNWIQGDSFAHGLYLESKIWDFDAVMQ